MNGCGVGIEWVLSERESEKESYKQYKMEEAFVFEINEKHLPRGFCTGD